MAFTNGQSGKLVVGGTNYHVENWTLNVSVEVLDTTNTGSGGWNENINGIKNAEGTARAFWDTAAMPTESGGLNIQAGNTATLLLYVGSGNKAFSVPARISQVTVENPARGVVPFTFNFVTNGSIVYPT